MLKTDFNGYAEFAEKILKAESNQEKKKLYAERIQMWVGKLENILSPIPAADEVFALVALHMTTEALEKADPEAALMARKFQKKIRLQNGDRANKSQYDRSSCKGIRRSYF